MLLVDGGGGVRGGELFLTSFKKNLPQEEEPTRTWHPQMSI